MDEKDLIHHIYYYRLDYDRTTRHVSVSMSSGDTF